MECLKQLRENLIKQKKTEIVKIYNFEQLRNIKDFKEYSFDLDSLPNSTDNKDIQNLNLENLNLNINIRKLWVPYERESYYRHFIPTNKTRFLHLNKSNLKGNNVEGDLSPFYDSRFGSVFIWYSEDTFDAVYKEKYPKFFLSKDAPKELKKIYYNPEIKDFVIRKKQTDQIVEKGKAYTRQTLTFEEYLNYYEYLQGKYLGNFKIEEKDKIMIQLVDYYGLEKSRKILNQLANLNLPFYLALMIFKYVDVEYWEQLFKNNAIQNYEIMENIVNSINTCEQKQIRKQ